jgi:hypothetical protein
MKNIQTLLLGVLIMLALGTSILSLLAVVVQENPSVLANASSQYASLNNTIMDLSEGISDIETSINSSVHSTDNEGIWGFVDALANSVVNSVKVVGRGMGFLQTFIMDITRLLPVPSWVGTLLVSAIVIIVGFAVWKAIFKV